MIIISVEVSTHLIIPNFESFATGILTVDMASSRKPIVRSSSASAGTEKCQ
jgi:hypothetical protein